MEYVLEECSFDVWRFMLSMMIMNLSDDVFFLTRLYITFITTCKLHHIFRGVGKTWEAITGSFTRMSRSFAMKDEIRAVKKIVRKMEQEAVSLDLLDEVRVRVFRRWFDQRALSLFGVCQALFQSDSDIDLDNLRELTFYTDLQRVHLRQ